jgi:hypothetical protein
MPELTLRAICLCISSDVAVLVVTHRLSILQFAVILLILVLA